MTDTTTYEYIAKELAAGMARVFADEYMTPKMRSLDGYGRFGKQQAWISNNLREMFAAAVCSPRRLVLVDGDGGDALRVYNGRYYEPANGGDFMVELCHRTLVAAGVGRNYYGDAKKIGLEALRRLQATDEWRYAPTPRYVNFTNVAFDLETGKVKEHDIRYAAGMCLDFEYKTPDECATGELKWTKKLWDDFLGDEGAGVLPVRDVRVAFQCWCGMLLADRSEVKWERMAVIYGPGSNGKSVLADAISSVFGERLVGKFSLQQLFKGKQDSMFCMNSLYGKVLNITGDLDKSDFSGGDFKRYTSGDTFPARGPHEKRFRMVKPPMLLCCANGMPDTSDDTEGHHRRFFAVPSTLRVWGEEDKDPTLTAKLTTDAAKAVIFNWIYAGYKKVRSLGWRLPITPEVARAQEAMVDGSNSVRRWWRDSEWLVAPASEIKPIWVSLRDLKQSYDKYCADTGDKVMEGNVVGRLLVSLRARSAMRTGYKCFALVRKMLPEQ